MRALAVLVVLVVTPTFAEPPADAPVRRVIRVGEPAPADGCYLNNRACENTGAELVRLRTENAELKAHGAELPTAILVAVFGLGVLAGGAAVYALRR